LQTAIPPASAGPRKSEGSSVLMTGSAENCPTTRRPHARIRIGRNPVHEHADPSPFRATW
jgi:hypothetical protein